MKQGTSLIATGHFSLRKPRSPKAAIVKPGDRFWVTSTELSNRSGMASIDREGRGQISQGYSLRLTDILANFEVAA